MPEDGRAFESFGEDPVLAADMGVADIEGIQSHQVMAQAKEFAVYSQETDRGALDNQVSDRPLEELYLRPFEAAVKQSHVASLMCAYPQLNGVYQCQDASILGLLDQWGFTGFVRSDLGAVHDPAAAIEAGTALIKPATVAGLTTSMSPGPPVGADHRPGGRACARHHVRLRRDRSRSDRCPWRPGRLPRARRRWPARWRHEPPSYCRTMGASCHCRRPPDRSVAVIGADAERDPVTTGFGSSRVEAPFVSTPLDAIRLRAGKTADVTYSPGGSTTAPLPPVPPEVLTPASGQGHGLTLTLVRAGPEATYTQTVQPTVDTSIRPYPGGGNSLLHAAGPDAPVEVRRAGGLTQQVFGSSSSIGGRRTLGGSLSERATRSDVVLPPGWTDVDATWTGTLTPPKTGDYTFSLQGSGASQLLVNGAPAVSDPLSHVLGRWSQTIPLTAGQPVSIEVIWDPFDTFHHQGLPTVVASSLTLGWKYVSNAIADAVAAAAPGQGRRGLRR